MSNQAEDLWSDERFNAMAELWELDEKDRKKLRELQERLRDVHHPKNDPYVVVRFYKEYKGKIPKVEKTFRQMIKWRETEGMETFLEDYGEPDPALYQWPTGILNTTCREGDPIFIDRWGATDFSGLVKKLGSEETSKYNSTFMREVWEDRDFWKPYETKAGRRVRQLTVIGDCKDLSFDLVRPATLGIFRTMARIGQDYYPGWTKRIIMLRAPKIYSYIFPMVKPFLDKNVQDMVVVTSESDYLEKVSKYIRLEDLPPCMSPTGKARGMDGHCAKIRFEGGKLVEVSSTADPPMDCSSDRTNVSAESLLRGVVEKPGRLSITASAS